MHVEMVVALEKSSPSLTNFMAGGGMRRAKDDT